VVGLVAAGAELALLRLLRHEGLEVSRKEAPGTLSRVEGDQLDADLVADLERK
jgi:hypothetical protein